MVYNHPDIDLLGATDVNDQGQNRQGYQLGDLALLRDGYASHLASGALLLLPQLARSRWSALGYNELQLRVVAKSRCFLAPQVSQQETSAGRRPAFTSAPHLASWRRLCVSRRAARVT